MMSDTTGNTFRGEDPFTKNFISYAEDLRSHYHVPSISIGVVDGDKSFFHVQGEAKVSDQKATKDTLYYIASLTKSFTATTLLSVLEDLSKTSANQDGQTPPLTLKSKLASIIPGDFVLPDAYATAHATLEDALAHTLGIGTVNLSYAGEGYTLRDAVQSLRHLPMTAEFREKHQYLNLGYMVIQHVVETLTGGECIGAAHHKYIWDPLGMDSTYIRLKDAKERKGELLATGYTWDGIVKDKLLETPYVDDWPLVGGGGIITSIKDLTTYLSAVINRNLPLSANQFDELFKPRAIVGGNPTNKHKSHELYGLGWNISSYRGRRIISHGGGICGFSSYLVFFPEEKWGISVLINADLMGLCAMGPLVWRLIDDYLSVPQDEREDMVPKMDAWLVDTKEKFLHSRESLFADIPSPVLPSTLPLHAYAGQYHNAGYRTIELKLLPVSSLPPGSAAIPFAPETTEVLHINLPRLMDITIDLEHVSGDHFLAWMGTATGGSLLRGATKGRFEVGADGTVARCGIVLETSGGTLVWFDRT